MRKIFSCKKIGHAGTLDPCAEGLLICAIENATRLIRYLPLEPKVYEFTIQFGEQTDTLDDTGTIERSGGTLPGKNMLESVLKSFIGNRLQKPPAFSALKIDGVRAYELARRGKKPEMQPRHITIHSLELLQYDIHTGRAECRVSCSAGTYIRALARDIAEALETYGYAISIKRTACGKFSLDNAHRLEEITESTVLISVEKAFDCYPCIKADSFILREASHGKNIALSINNNKHKDARIVLLFDCDDLAALCTRIENNVYHPLEVFLKQVKE